MEDYVKNEELDICRECGGMCCNKCGCDYAVSDFKEKTYQGFIEALSDGDKSIVAMIDFRTLSNGRIVPEPLLYIRARNINRDIIDLVSMKTRCASLLDDGCKHDYEHRPFGGRNLKPVRECDGACYPIVDPMLMVKAWGSYQKQLAKIVRFYTGKSVVEKISEDVEELIYKCLIRDYEGVSALEFVDLKRFVPLLVQAYPNEYTKAMERYKSRPYSRVLNKK